MKIATKDTKARNEEMRKSKNREREKEKKKSEALQKRIIGQQPDIGWQEKTNRVEPSFFSIFFLEIDAPNRFGRLEA